LFRVADVARLYHVFTLLTSNRARAVLVLRCEAMSKVSHRRHRPAASDVELRQLRAFVAIAESASVTAASRSLGVAQSTLSEALAALERAVSTSLVQRGRGPKGVVLTAAGQALLPHAREVLAAVERLHVAVANAVASARGVVQIITNESISTYILSRVLAGTRAHWPNTQFPITVATCADVRRGVAEGSFDVGFLLEAVGGRRPRPPNVTSFTRGSAHDIVVPVVPLVAFTLPSHPLAQSAQRPVPRNTIAEFPVFVSDSAGDFKVLIEQFFHGDGLPVPPLQATGTVEGVKKSVMAAERAIGILPAYAISNEVRSGHVVCLDVRPKLPTMSIVAVLSQSRERHPSIEEIVNGVGNVFTTRQARSPDAKMNA
jgi:LysR family transcriptional regulator, nitrogen assimilation regulatory protein